MDAHKRQDDSGKSGHQWFRVVPIRELADGEMRCLAVMGHRTLLAHSNGVFYAADEYCTHEDASLCLGALRDGRVKCPLHGSWFDLSDGSVEDEPATEPLRVYPSRVRDGWLEIDLRDPSE